MKQLFIFIFILLSINSVLGQSDSLHKVGLKLKDSSSLLFDKRPKKAFLIGVILPGAGQVYNKRWWKLPIVYGAYGLAVYNIKYKRDLYTKWEAFYQTALIDGKVEVVPGRFFDVKQTKTNRDITRDGKDVALFTIIGVHLLVSLEAYVDAHLKNFNIDDDLSFKFSPQSGGLALVYNLH